jgi:hypothetical protein
MPKGHKRLDVLRRLFVVTVGIVRYRLRTDRFHAFFERIVRKLFPSLCHPSVRMPHDRISLCHKVLMSECPSFQTTQTIRVASLHRSFHGNLISFQVQKEPSSWVTTRFLVSDYRGESGRGSKLTVTCIYRMSEKSHYLWRVALREDGFPDRRSNAVIARFIARSVCFRATKLPLTKDRQWNNCWSLPLSPLHNWQWKCVTLGVSAARRLHAFIVTQDCYVMWRDVKSQNADIMKQTNKSGVHWLLGRRVVMWLWIGVHTALLQAFLAWCWAKVQLCLFFRS